MISKILGAHLFSVCLNQISCEPLVIKNPVHDVNLEQKTSKKTFQNVGNSAPQDFQFRAQIQQKGLISRKLCIGVQRNPFQPLVSCRVVYSLFGLEIRRIYTNKNQLELLLCYNIFPLYSFLPQSLTFPIFSIYFPLYPPFFTLHL